MSTRLGEKGRGKRSGIYSHRIFRSRRNFPCYAVAPHKKFLTLHGKSDLLDYMVKTRTHGTLTNLCHKFGEIVLSVSILSRPHLRVGASNPPLQRKKLARTRPYDVGARQARGPRQVPHRKGGSLRRAER